MSRPFAILFSFLFFSLISSAEATSWYFKRGHGNIFINLNQVPTKIKFKKGEFPLKVGDLIEANGETSWVELQHGEEILRLKNGSMTLSGIPDQKSPSIFDLAIGEAMVSIKKLATDNKGKKDKKKSESETLTIKTPLASFGVRGTKFYVQVKPESSYLCVCEGAVLAQNSKGGESILVNAGEDLHAKQGQALSKQPATSMMMDMSWDILEDMGDKRPNK